ncbi:type I toxin-antitoxin system Fst family toxin [Salinicoccus sp. ID82-1]|nr:type I toxin-antitoxin system Fst family toxin [Salinicoccus sp. ID82-1]MCG1010926.1 type I toxin-antitoxin system Fst family toxin [Salinicoccus sp. ID82-1]
MCSIIFVFLIAPIIVSVIITLFDYWLDSRDK